ncbi:MAG: hypothetical protein E7157_05465 [Lactobacillales bacterium]|nr:hypothetical protein [Lactobacillales bacterium]
MNFNEKQSKLIYDFILKYNSEEEFKNNVQNLYDNEISNLSILYIYALEEILRYGNKGIFNKFLKTKGIYDDEQAIDSFDNFVQLFNNDINFKEYKIEQLKDYPETLSEMELFAFSLIGIFENDKEQIEEEPVEELEYDEFNPILYSTDEQIKETLENLFFGEFIHKLLELPAMKNIKDRQKENGRIANIDKPFLIEKIQGVISEDKSMTQFEQAIDSRYIKVKMNVLLGKGEEAFNEYIGFNTNISSNEILGIRRDNYSDMYDFFMNIIRDKKGESTKPPKK